MKIKRQIFKTGKDVKLHSRLNGLRVTLKGIVVKNWVAKKECIIRTDVGNEIKFSYKSKDGVEIIGGFR